MHVATTTIPRRRPSSNRQHCAIFEVLPVQLWLTHTPLHGDTQSEAGHKDIKRRESLNNKTNCKLQCSCRRVQADAQQLLLFLASHKFTSFSRLITVKMQRIRNHHRCHQLPGYVLPGQYCSHNISLSEMIKIAVQIN